MSDEKFSQFALASEVKEADVIVGLQDGDNVQFPVDLFKNGAMTVTDPLALNGIDDTTTAVLNYGINIIRTSTTTNFCARLPVAKTGQSVVIINLSNFKARIFPSVTGGSINGVVDGFVDVLNNALPVSIFCYDNPDPGDWGANSPQINQTIVIPEMSVPHTNGSDTFYCGVGVAQNSPVGGGFSGSHITLQPDSEFWRTENFKASSIVMRVATNIVAGDAPTGHAISAFKHMEFVQSDHSEAGIDCESCSIGDSFYGQMTVNQGGPVNSPANVGDNGTLSTSAVYTSPPSIGLANGTYSPFFYIFCMQIPSACLTKTYKFRFEIDYKLD